MRLSQKYRVPSELALLYDFVNTLDQRRFLEHGVVHETGDELATKAQFETWMRAHDLLARRCPLRKADHAQAIELRDALRAFLRLAPEDRHGRDDALVRLNKVCAGLPLVLKIDGPAPALQPADGANALGCLVAQFHALAQSNRLDRFKMCASEDCRWVFYDRSRPGNRRWCSSALCGNRHKTRAYRERQTAANKSP